MNHNRSSNYQHCLLNFRQIVVIIVTIAITALSLPRNTLAQFGEGIQPIVENEYTENVTVGDTSLTTFEIIISNLLGLGTVIGSIIFIAYFLLGAISWISAGGDSGKITKARDQMLQGVLGLIVLVALYAIVGLVGSIVGLNILNPAQVLESLVPNTP